MSAFLFWNLNGKNIADHVAELALERLADFDIVAECESPASLLKALNDKLDERNSRWPAWGADQGFGKEEREDCPRKNAQDVLQSDVEVLWRTHPRRRGGHLLLLEGRGCLDVLEHL